MPRLSKYCSKISQRWLIVALLFFAFLNMFSMRICLSIAITEMALPRQQTKKFSDDTCSENVDEIINNNSRLNTMSKRSNENYQFDWSEKTQGLILSSFYWGYAITNILGGMISQKFGSKRVLATSIFFTSAFCLLTPYCTTHGGSINLILVRLATGLAEGATQPSVADLLAHWIPQYERARAASVVYSSIPLGTIYGMIPSGFILQHSEVGWPMVFYFYGTTGFMSFLLIVAFCYSEPRQSPFITDEELNYLTNNLKNMHPERPPPPWRHILKSLPVWALCFATIGESYGLITVMSDMPKYMNNILKFSVQNNGLLSSIPHLSMWIATGIFCWVADKLLVTKSLSIIIVRKVSCAIGIYGSATFILAAAYAGCNGILATSLLTVALVCMGGVFCSVAINSLDLSPNYAGTILGMANGLSVMFAMLSPYIIGLLTPNQTIGEWRIAFWIVFIVMVASTTVFLVYGKADVQEWNDPGFLNGRGGARESDVKEAVDLLRVGE